MTVTIYFLRGPILVLGIEGDTIEETSITVTGVVSTTWSDFRYTVEDDSGLTVIVPVHNIYRVKEQRP